MKTLIDYILNKQSFKHFIKNPSDFRFIIHYLEREQIGQINRRRKGEN